MSAAILFNGFGANGIVTDVAGTALEYPAVLESTATSWTAELELSVYSYVGPTVTQNTRTFNGELTGPTIKVKPGDTLQVALTNSLAEEAHDTSSLHNEYRDLDTTNLHTHGLHIDGEPPGDSIFTEVKPGETYTYTYEIPDDHLGGTFWRAPRRLPPSPRRARAHAHPHAAERSAAPLRRKGTTRTTTAPPPSTRAAARPA